VATTALTDVFSYVSEYDFTCDTNNAMLDLAAAELDATTFCSSGWTTKIAGLKSVKYDMAGFWQSAANQAVDPQAFPRLGTVDEVFTVGPVRTEATGVTSSGCYLFKAGKFSYEQFGQVGTVAPFKLSSMGTNGVGVRRGWLLKAKGSVSATGQLGQTFDTALGSASSTLYATVHIFTVGTTITIQLQSDDNTGFTTPTTLATIGPLTAVGGTWMTPVAGNSDRYLRFNVSANTGTHSVAAALAT